MIDRETEACSAFSALDTLPGDDGGIAEEYADALAAICALEKALAGRVPTNDTPDGRLLLTLAWLKQEIVAQRLPIPVEARTVFYLVGSGELNPIPGVKAPLHRLYLVLTGIGLIKPRHVPLLLSMIDDFYTDAQAIWSELPMEEREVMDDLHARGAALRLKAEWPMGNPLQRRQTGLANPVLERHIPDFNNRMTDITASLFEQWRPYAAKKPPLDPPHPGLPRNAPPEPERPYPGWFRP